MKVDLPKEPGSHRQPYPQEAAEAVQSPTALLCPLQREEERLRLPTVLSYLDLVELVQQQNFQGPLGFARAGLPYGL